MPKLSDNCLPIPTLNFLNMRKGLRPLPTTLDILFHFNLIDVNLAAMSELEREGLIRQGPERWTLCDRHTWEITERGTQLAIMGPDDLAWDPAWSLLRPEEICRRGLNQHWAWRIAQEMCVRPEDAAQLRRDLRDYEMELAGHDHWTKEFPRRHRGTRPSR